LLAQSNEFSIVLALTAFTLKLIDTYVYQLTLSVVALSMFITSFWIGVIRTFLFQSSDADKAFIQ